MLRIIVIVFFLASSCEEQALRDQSRPSDEGADVPGFLDETTRSVKAKDSATITIGKTTIAIPEGALAEDAEVRLRTLKSQPEREEVASLGKAKGDIVEVTMYNKGTDEIYASTVLDQPFTVSQVLTDVSDEDNLMYVVLPAPGTDDEVVQVLSRKAITNSTALTGTDLSVSIELSATHVIFYAVESAEVSGAVIILDSGTDTSNDSGGSISTSSTSSSSTSSSSSSSSGSSIDCSGLGHDPGNESWIQVSANTEVGQFNDFCVMKYEAKKARIDDVDKAVSQPSGAPWSYVARDSARQHCSAIGNGYTLIKNSMWQTIARSAEVATNLGVFVNWSGGTVVGDSTLNQGNSDGGPGTGLPADDVGDPDDNPCVGTENSNCTDRDHVHFAQKRTHTLSNGKVIWDLAGNVWEWVYEEFDEAQGIAGYISQSPMNDKSAWGAQQDYSAKTNEAYGGLGEFDMTNSGAVLRGGGYNNSGIDAGLFSTSIGLDSSYLKDYVGFRCAYSE